MLGAVLQNIHPRIYYGEDASPGEFPSIVSLQVENMHSCGATMFKSEEIISATHCVVDADVSKLSAVAGTIDLRNNGSVHQVTTAIPHEGYDPNNYFINDIAVLKMTPQFLFDGVNIEAVNLPSSGEGDSGGPLYASGVEIGIVSLSSRGCGSRNSPIIYVNVSSYI
uniref:Peptidase S1 domain-containing protein n=1 Tax=Timema bartmani TaxID=61472 RepID=A0A7R9F4A6_9NEOP|nr:unnamed protein product [Timema bartmani]